MDKELEKYIAFDKMEAEGGKDLEEFFERTLSDIGGVMKLKSGDRVINTKTDEEFLVWQFLGNWSIISVSSGETYHDKPIFYDEVSISADVLLGDDLDSWEISFPNILEVGR